MRYSIQCLLVAILGAGFMLAGADDSALRWAWHLGGLGNGGYVTAIAADPQGNILAAGSFSKQNALTRGSKKIPLDLTRSRFLAKFDENGEVLWLRQFQGSGRVSSLAVGDDGSFVVAGFVFGDVELDSHVGVASRVALQKEDPFVAKYDREGNHEWSHVFVDDEDGGVKRIAIAPDGQVIAVGAFYGEIEFGQSSGVRLKSVGSSDIYIAKLDRAGQLTWVRHIGGPESDHLNCIVIDSAGNLYCGGRADGLVDVDPGPDVHELSGPNTPYILKLSAEGSLLWVRNLIVEDIANFFALTLDTNGNVYAAGNCVGQIDFDPGPGEAFLDALGQEDACVLKLHGDGSFIWAKRFGGEATELVESVAVDSNENVYVGGTFREFINLDRNDKALPTQSRGEIDVFLMALDRGGNIRWTGHMGGANSDALGEIVVDEKLRLTAAGFFFGSGDFDPGPPVHTFTAASESMNGYLVQIELIAPQPHTAPARRWPYVLTLIVLSLGILIVAILKLNRRGSGA